MSIDAPITQPKHQQSNNELQEWQAQNMGVDMKGPYFLPLVTHILLCLTPPLHENLGPLPTNAKNLRTCGDHLWATVMLLSLAKCNDI